MHSLDFRKTVIRVRKENKWTIEETADFFKISIASIVRWLRELEPKVRKARATKISLDVVEQDVLEHPDKFQSERAKELGVAQSTMWGYLKKLKITCKKNSSSRESQSIS